MDADKRVFDYRPRATYVVACTVFSVLGIVAFIPMALSNDRGLVINDTIHLDRDQATLLCWAFEACSIVGLCYSIALIRRRSASRPQLVFGPSALSAPLSRWSVEVMQIPYSEIRALSTARDGGQRLLHVAHAGGSYTVNSSMLPSNFAFQEVCELLSAKVRAAKSVP